MARCGSRSSVPGYVYEPISRANKEIRLVTILPDWEHEADIYVRISKTTFNPKAELLLHELSALGHIAATRQRKYYEALSYTWGDAHDPRTIYVVDDEQKKNVRSLQVTRNCETALRYLRFIDIPCVMWIDAICIDQANNEEKGRQVSIMAQIYSQAFRVTAWLGPATHDSDMAIDLINAVGDRLQHDASTNRLVPTNKTSLRNGRATSNSDPWAAMSDVVSRLYDEVSADLLEPTSKNPSLRDLPLITSAHYAAFANFLERDYFERLWVWQEIWMGGSRASLWCGNRFTTFKNVFTAIRFVGEPRFEQDYGDFMLRVGPRIQFISDLPLFAPSVNSLSTMEDLRRCKCADQRDRIYTSQVFRDRLETRVDVKPNYNRSVEDVYIDFAQACIRSSRNLYVLNYVGDTRPAWQSGESAPSTSKLPSWVPDWREVNSALRLSHNHAMGATTLSSVLSFDRKRLVVHGLMVDRIVKASRFGMGIEPEDFVKKDWTLTFEHCLRDVVALPMPDDALSELAEVLCAFRHGESTIPKQRGNLPLRVFVDFLKWLLGSKFDPDPLHAQRIALEHMTYTQMAYMWGRLGICQGRALYKTEHGRYGIGPGLSQPGDRLVALLGNPFIFIVRPVSDGSGAYRIVGSASCTGLMCQEAFLGPLPTAYKPVSVFVDSSGRSYPQLRHKQTGELHAEDPRLPALPKEWAVMRPDKKKQPQFLGVPLIYVHRATGLHRDYRQDPRMDLEALLSRGVPLQEICLV